MTNEEQEWVDELCDVESGLYPDEIDFIDDLVNNYKDRELTERQHDWLERIHRRLCS